MEKGEHYIEKLCENTDKKSGRFREVFVRRVKNV